MSPGFLSTLPARGATHRASRDCSNVSHFYPRSPRGERLAQPIHPAVFHAISIHAPREGSDMVSVCVPMFADLFLSTLPARGATEHSMTLTLRGGISIHAPREGSDRRPILTASYGTVFLSTLPARGATTSAMTAKRTKQDFYPRSPRGERLIPFAHLILDSEISIHAPREGSDVEIDNGKPATWAISIHAPREGSDILKRLESMGLIRFLSTLPARGATCPGHTDRTGSPISIHAPREGSDGRCQDT